MAYKPDEFRYVNYMWEDSVVNALDAVERLRYRSNLLGPISVSPIPVGAILRLK